MNEEDIETAINALLSMLVSNGFQWAADQALEALPANTTRAAVALALIDAAECVSIGLAETEQAAHELLRVDEMSFKPDQSEGIADTERAEDRRRDVSPIKGPEKTFAFLQISKQKTAFDKLKGLIDGPA